MRARFSIPTAFAWLIGNRIVVQISNLGLLICAARLLTPVELGKFALASGAALFISVIAEAGWRQYILAWSETPDPPPTAFWSAVAASVVGAVIGMIGAAAGIAWFQDKDFGWLLLIFAALIPLGAVTTVEYGLLNRRGRLRMIAALSSTAAVLSFAAGFAALAMGAGIYALAVARVVRDVTSVVSFCVAAGWIPRPEIDRRLLPGILKFARKITASQLLYFSSTYSAEFVIAAFLGVAEVGIYRLASRICGSLVDLVGEPLRILAWSVFARGRTEDGRLAPMAKEGETFAFFSILLAMPAFAGLAVAAPDLVEVLVGPRWADTASVLSILALANLLWLPGLFFESLFSISGSIRLLPWLAACNAAVSLVLLVLLAPWGPAWAAGSQLLTAAIILPVSIVLQQVYGGLNWRRVGWLLLPALPAVAGMAVVAYAARLMAHSVAMPMWGALAGQVILGAAAYSILAYVLYPSMRSTFWNWLRTLM